MESLSRVATHIPGINATTRAAIAEIQRTGAGTLKAIAQELEARGVRTPARRDRWDAKQVSRLLAV
jgi:hypothetical protein